MSRTGIQRDVLLLYRLCMKEAMKKPPVSRENFRQYARDEFRAHIGIDKKDFETIEYLLRVGQKKLDIYSQPGVKNIFQ